jgi:hypothetical protein
VPAATLGQLIGRHGVDVLDHLDREADVPVLDGLQFQGDLAVIPDAGNTAAGRPLTDVPAPGLPVIEAAGGGHEHRLLASAPGTARFAALTGADIGVLVADAPAYLAHPEHGYLGIAPGTYLLRRQREQAGEERMVAD